MNELVTTGNAAVQSQYPATAISAETMEMVMGKGDLSKLTAPQRVEFLMGVCKSLNLNPLTMPMSFQDLGGRTVLYAKKDCTDQLRSIHKVSVKIVSREKIGDDVYMVTAQAELPDGRTDEAIGAVPIGKLIGEGLANAMMKAETKAKRRVTLSICGLGFVDEIEADAANEAMAKPMPGPVQCPWKTKREMLQLFEAEKARLGAETYYRVLGAEGEEEAGNITDKPKAERLYAALRMESVQEAEVVNG